MMSNENIFSRVRRSWVQIILPALTLILGILGDAIWGNRADIFVSSGYLPFTIFFLLVVVLGFCLAIWGLTQKKIANMENQTALISKAIGQKASILPYSQGYDLLQSKYEHAKSEILILSKYVFDWKKNKSIYDSKRLKSPSRRKAYDTAIEKIRAAMKEGNFKYSLVVQVPKGYSLGDVFPFDPIYKKYATLLMRSNKMAPEAASLKTTDVVFPNTFVLVDRSFLYLEFEIKDPDTGEEKAPFVLTIDDPNSEMVLELLRVHQRLEANASLLAH